MPLIRLLSLIWILGLASVLSTPAAAEFANTPDATWMTNGTVRAVIRSGDNIYIGGKFTSVRSCPTGTTCAGAFTANNVAAFNANTGVAISTFHPAVTGDASVTVYALAVLDGKLFIGGKFNAVDGVPRRNFAAVDALTGALNPNVDALVGTTASHSVRALLTMGTRVYVGGAFTTIDGQTRVRLAAFDGAGKLDIAFKPRANATVQSLAPDCAGATLFAGGLFDQASGTSQPFVSRETIARFDPVSGALHDWQVAPGAIPIDLRADDLAPTCDRLFAAYAGANGQNWTYAFDLTTDSSTALWGRKADGDVQTIAVAGSRVLIGGHFELLLVNQQWTPRARFAALDHDGNLDPWIPAFAGQFYGPWDILVDDDKVWVGGSFNTVSGVAQRSIARFTDNP